MTGRAQQEQTERESFMMSCRMTPSSLSCLAEGVLNVKHPHIFLISLFSLVLLGKQIPIPFCFAEEIAPNVDVISEFPTKLTHSIGRKDMPKSG